MSAPGDTERRVVTRLESLEPDARREALLRCCGSRRWARRVAASAPFGSDAELQATAEAVWWELAPDDWREAFAAHPRIGERGGGRWSEREQAGMAEADDALRREIREGNRAYERKFGHVFLICAAGLGARDMADALADRLENDPAAELRNAAAEQAKITRLRLEKLGAT